MYTYIRTRTGLKFPLSPAPEDVRIEDIAHALSRAPRWGGHTDDPYPVAAHSIHVANRLPSHLKLEGLLHDASEAYLADIPRPFKALMPDYYKVENTVMTAVAKRFSINWPLDPLTKREDEVVLYLERKNLFSFPVGEDVPAFPGVPDEWNWNFWKHQTDKQIAELFLDAFEHCKP